jgi:hypothetical protein
MCACRGSQRVMLSKSFSGEARSAFFPAVLAERSAKSSCSFREKRRFISALTYLPPTPLSPTPLILSAGGDFTIQVFDLPTGALLNQFPIEELLVPLITVGPEMPPPVPAGKKKSNRGKGKGKGKEEVVEGGDEDQVVEGEGEMVEGEGEMVEGEGEAEMVVGTTDEATGDGSSKIRGWKDGITTGLAVIKMVAIGSREEGGVLVLASG